MPSHKESISLTLWALLERIYVVSYYLKLLGIAAEPKNNIVSEIEISRFSWYEKIQSSEEVEKEKFI